MIAVMARRLTSPTLVGRDDELSQLRSALSAAQGGTAQVVLVGGDAGVGKTRLVRELLDRATADGHLVLTGGCVDLGEGTLPFGPVIEALRRLHGLLDDATLDELLGPAAEELGRLVPELGHFEYRAAAVHQPGRLFELLLGVLDRLGRRAPTVLVVEDIHWADQSTRDLLSFLARNLREERVLLIATYRTDELHRRHPLRPFLAELRRSPVLTLAVAPLDRDEVRALATNVLGRAPSDALVDAVFQRSEGNAFFAEELLAAIDEGDRLPPSLRDILLARIEGLPERAQLVLRVAAAAGRRVVYDVLADLTGLDEEELVAVLRDLVARHLLVPDATEDAYSFRHALLLEAVYQELLPGERTRLHAAIAGALAAKVQPGDPSTAGELAHHWYAARDHTRALPALVAAGLAAEGVSAPAEALMHYERALELWSAVPDAANASPLAWVEIVRRAADAASVLGRLERAVALGREALVAVDPKTEPVLAGLLHERLGRYLWLAGSAGSFESYEEAVRLVPADPPSAERARVLGALGQALMLAGRWREGRSVCEDAIAIATTVGALEEEGHARNSLGVTRVNMGDPRGLDDLRNALDIARRVNNAEEECRAYLNLSYSLTMLGRFDESVQTAIEGAALAARMGFEHTHGVFLGFNAFGALMALGRWDDAEVQVEAAVARVPEGVWQAAFTSVVLRANRGDFATAHAELEQSVALPPGADAQAALPRAFGGATLALWEGRPEVVRDMVRHAIEAVPIGVVQIEAPQLLWLAVWAEADRAEQARARHDDESAAECAAAAADATLRCRQLVAEPGPTGGVAMAWAGGFLLMADAERARAAGRSDPEAWAAAAAELGRWGHSFEVAYACFRQAEAILDAGGDRDEAASLLRLAAANATTLRARPLLDHVERLARRARIALAATTTVSPAPEGDAAFGLTPREREVLVLVAEGRTNRQIADELFISVKTASVHVSNILAKLGVGTRGEAGAVAHRLGLDVA